MVEKERDREKSSSTSTTENLFSYLMKRTNLNDDYLLIFIPFYINSICLRFSFLFFSIYKFNNNNTSHSLVSQINQYYAFAFAMKNLSNAMTESIIFKCKLYDHNNVNCKDVAPLSQ